ncbi:MAG: nucleotidyltransferase domain-containing protein [Actinomycetota bacterium]|nr:nucleotidyltransferase domain-containing protein [Actinomycetota bacterium]
MTTSRAIAPNSAPDLTLLRSKRQEILRLATRHGASNVRVFGSVARGEAHRESDIDLLVEFDLGPSLVDEAELRQELELLLGYRVELAEDVHHAIRDRVLAEALAL